jgi:hypothetical protein
MDWRLDPARPIVKLIIIELKSDFFDHIDERKAGRGLPAGFPETDLRSYQAAIALAMSA